MRRLIVLHLIICSLILSSIPGFSNSIENIFWEKAVEIAEKNKFLLPSTITEIEVVSNKKKEIIENNLTQFQIIDHRNNLDLKLLSRIEDGKDTTEEFLKEFKKNKKKILNAILEDTIFLKRMQSKIKLESSEISSHEVIYTFSLLDEGLSFDGLAKIDKAEGHAIYSQVYCKEIKDKDGLIKNFKETIYYKKNKKMWVPEKIIQTMDIETTGFVSFFKFKGSVSTEIIFNNFFIMKKN